MCGIVYQPCTRDSFRIGPNRAQNMSNATNNMVPAMIATNSGNASAINLNAVPTNSSATDVIEGSGAGLPEQEMVFTSSTNLVPFLGRLCRDRVLIPCDFEEFITVRSV